MIQALSSSSFTKSISDYTIQFYVVVILKGSVKALLEGDKAGTIEKVIYMMYNMYDTEFLLGKVFEHAYSAYFRFVLCFCNKMRL